MYGLAKLAALKSDVHLYPHQERVRDKEGDSIIIAHGVGSGKTLSGIARFEKLKTEGKAHKALVVAPAGLRDNFGESGVGKFTDSKYRIIGNKQEMKKGGLYGGVDPNADYNILSYEMFRRNPLKYLNDAGADTVIADEYHRGKNEGTGTTDALKQLKGHYKNFIGLTGSVISNSVSDVQPLVDIASDGNNRLGESKKDFEQTYLKRSDNKIYAGLNEKRIPVVGFKHKKQLEDELSKYIDYMDYDDIKDIAHMPNKHVVLHKIPITKDQARIYKGLLNDNPSVKRMITNKRIETMRDEEAAKAFSALIESRKLMNSIGSVKPGVSLKESAEETPKTKALLDSMQKHLEETPDGQAILLTHLINGGSDVLEAGLKSRHIPYGTFLGKGNKGVTEESRQQDVRDFNNRKKRVMLISSAGGEGVSLNDTTWEGVLDPHYNPERMNQMEARGIRSGGLSHRPEDQREVEVNRYIATMPKVLGVFPSSYKTPDEFIYEIAQNKNRQNQLLFNLLKESQRRQQEKARVQRG
jgi:SNF2 family DNA or RNA helicase